MSQTNSTISLKKYNHLLNKPDELIEKICHEQKKNREDSIEISMEEYLRGKIASEKLKSGKDTKQKPSDIQKLKDAHEKRGEFVEPVVQQAIQQKLLSEENPSIDLFSLNCFKNRLKDLSDHFPGASFNHALAVKANPIRGILRVAKEMGFGAECASFAEAKHALSLGFEPRRVVYDSPCKLTKELEEMLQEGCYINLDNENEIQKVNTIFKALKIQDFSTKHSRQIGLRINPVVGGGTIASTSTATATSKFGLPLTDSSREHLISIYEKNPWLQGVHVHVGSQGCALELLVEGARRAVDFAEAVNAKLGRQQIQVIDIGGGMPTIYDGLTEAYTFKEYAKAIRNVAPELFTDKYHVITEFGRSVMVKPGITLTRVEAVKEVTVEKDDNVSPHRIAVLHVGANQFLRTAYLPDQWKHVFTLFSRTGQVKNGNTAEVLSPRRSKRHKASNNANGEEDFYPYDLAGPLCFSGDYLGKDVYLPPMVAEDHLVIHDTGGYTVSMYSKYNSRCASAMYAYEVDANDPSHIQFFLLKERETTEETLRFWGVSEMQKI